MLGCYREENTSLDTRLFPWEIAVHTGSHETLKQEEKTYDYEFSMRITSPTLTIRKNLFSYHQNVMFYMLNVR